MFHARFLVVEQAERKREREREREREGERPPLTSSPHGTHAPSSTQTVSVDWLASWPQTHTDASKTPFRYERERESERQREDTVNLHQSAYIR